MSEYYDLSKLSKTTMKKINTLMRLAALQLFRAVILKTPVDTGRARANWQVTVGKPASETLKSTWGIANNMSEIIEKVTDSSLQKGVFLTNNLPYIQKLEFGGYPNPPKKGSYLKTGQKKGQYTGPGFFKMSENGYSKQAPQGMVRVSIKEIVPKLGQMLEEIVSKDKYINNLNLTP